jgi:hypothetical protein
LSSSGRNARPATIGGDISLKKSAETRPDRSCSGNPPPVKFITPVLKADTSCTTWLCC